MARPVGGTVTVSVRGRQYVLKGDVNVQPGGVQRKVVEDVMTGGSYYTETTIPGALEMTIVMTPDVLISDIRGFAGVIAQSDCASGRSYTTSDLTCLDVTDLNLAAGTCKASFTSSPMTEVVR